MCQRVGARYRKHVLVLVAVLSVVASSPSFATFQKADNVPLEQLTKAVKGAVDMLEKLGQPISADDRHRLQVVTEKGGDQAIGQIQDILDRYCLLEIHINEEGWPSVLAAASSPTDRLLAQGKWKLFLVKVYNESAVKAPIAVRSPQELLPVELKAAEKGSFQPSNEPDSWYRWLGLKTYENTAAIKDTAGPSVYYVVLGILSRDQGMRAADLEFGFRGGTVSQGHYVSQRLLFGTQHAAMPTRK